MLNSRKSVDYFIHEQVFSIRYALKIDFPQREQSIHPKTLCDSSRAASREKHLTLLGMPGIHREKRKKFSQPKNYLMTNVLPPRLTATANGVEFVEWNFILSPQFIR